MLRNNFKTLLSKSKQLLMYTCKNNMIMMSKLTSLLLIFVTTSSILVSQEVANQSFESHIDKVYPALSIDRSELNTAVNIEDLNRYFKADWVREYQEVVISAVKNGQSASISSPSNTITKAQKELMRSADNGSDIRVDINYIPENTLKNNEAKDDHFSFSINVDKPASFPGGSEQLEKYLNEHVLSRITKDDIPIHNLAAVKFTVDKKGNIHNVEVAASSNNEEIDAHLITVVKEMPNWIPAEYADGTKISQDNMLTVGDMRNCTINTLNIKRKNFEIEE